MGVSADIFDKGFSEPGPSVKLSQPAGILKRRRHGSILETPSEPHPNKRPRIHRSSPSVREVEKDITRGYCGRERKKAKRSEGERKDDRKKRYYMMFMK